MRQGQAGYATIAATGMLAGLSVLGISYMNLSRATLDISERTTRQLLLDGVLEEQLAETITQLANGMDETSDYPKQKRLSDTSVAITIENERDKLSLHRATELTLMDALMNIDLGRGQARHIQRKFREQRINSSHAMSIDSIVPADMDARALNCLQSVISEFKPPAVFKRPGAKENLEGEILRVQVETESDGTPSRGLEAFVLFTGDRADPVWVLKWNRYSRSAKEGCKS